MSAGDWIKMRVDLRDDPAVIFIADTLRIGRDAVVGKLQWLWSWLDQNAPLNGSFSFPHVKAKFVDEKVEKVGFAAAMHTAGWLDYDENGGLIFPDAQRHNGKTAKARAVDAKYRQQVRELSEKCPGGSRTESRPIPDEQPTRERSRSRSTPKHSPVPKNKDQVQESATASRRAPKKPLPANFSISERVRHWATERGYDRLDERLQHFISKAKAKGYVYVNWDEALMGAIRDDWAKLSKNSTLSAAGQQTADAGKRWIEDEEARDAGDGT